MTRETLRGAGAEILGTGVFVGLLVIFGAIASRLLGASGLALLASTSGVALGLVGILVNLRPVSGAHMNPAITLGAAIQGDVQWTNVPRNAPFEGNYGPTNRGSRITQRMADGALKVAVVDPRASNVATKAWKWVPIQPGGEGAMALGMIRWVLYMGTPVYSLPAGHTNIEVLADVKRLPLVVASDIVIGGTSMYADYIFPDVSNLERWEFAGSHPNMVWKVQPVRQPVIGPIPETVRVYGQEIPLGLEAMLLAMAEKLGLPGFGPNAFGPGKPFTHSDHLYLRMAANLAVGDKPGEALPDASADELRIFLESRAYLPKSVFDAERWKAIVGPELWPKLVYLLNPAAASTTSRRVTTAPSSGTSTAP